MSTNIYDEAAERRKVGDVYKDTRGVEMTVTHCHYDYESLAELAKYYWAESVLEDKNSGKEYVRLYTLLYLTEYFMSGLIQECKLTPFDIIKSNIIHCDKEYWIELNLVHRIMQCYEGIAQNGGISYLRNEYYTLGHERYWHMLPFEEYRGDQQ